MGVKKEPVASVPPKKTRGQRWDARFRVKVVDHYLIHGFAKTRKKFPQLPEPTLVSWVRKYRENHA